MRKGALVGAIAAAAVACILGGPALSKTDRATPAVASRGTAKSGRSPVDDLPLGLSKRECHLPRGGLRRAGSKVRKVLPYPSCRGNV